jgi:hypothetical protein
MPNWLAIPLFLLVLFAAVAEFGPTYREGREQGRLIRAARHRTWHTGKFAEAMRGLDLVIGEAAAKIDRLARQLHSHQHPERMPDCVTFLSLPLVRGPKPDLIVEDDMPTEWFKGEVWAVGEEPE